MGGTTAGAAAGGTSGGLDMSENWTVTVLGSDLGVAFSFGLMVSVSVDDGVTE
jgi:hypothetical protein